MIFRVRKRTHCFIKSRCQNTLDSHIGHIDNHIGLNPCNFVNVGWKLKIAFKVYFCEKKRNNRGIFRTKFSSKTFITLRMTIGDIHSSGIFFPFEWKSQNDHYYKCILRCFDRQTNEQIYGRRSRSYNHRKR